MLNDLLHRMLAKDPNKRITLENIKQHPWMTSERVHTDFKSIDPLRIRHDPLLAPLDPALLEQMSRLDVDASDLAECFAVRKETAATATYQILLREKMREDATDALPSLTKSVLSLRDTVKRETADQGTYRPWTKFRSLNSWDIASKKRGKISIQRIFRATSAGDIAFAGTCVYAF
jgi:serine/threonine protein kinase